jgi:hypothetical protein
MKISVIIAIGLIVLGAAVLGYEHYSYTTRDQILQIGPLTATAEQTHTVLIPPIIGWLLIGAGACAIAFGAWSRKP